MITIVWGDVVKTERGDFEDIENTRATVESLSLRFGNTNGRLEECIDIVPLTDFMDMCNNEQFDVYGNWITYVHMDELELKKWRGQRND